MPKAIAECGSHQTSCHCEGGEADCGNLPPFRKRIHLYDMKELDMHIDIQRADYTNPRHATDIVTLLNHYAMDSAGGGEALSDKVQAQLVAELAKQATAFSLLAYVDEKAVGLANCFWGFSTFKCKPLVNIHDIVVLDGCRGQGIGQRLLQDVEVIAQERGACKLTLEVLEYNHPAQAAYTRFGFACYELDPDYGRALFLEKKLPKV